MLFFRKSISTRCVVWPFHLIYVHNSLSVYNESFHCVFCWVTGIHRHSLQIWIPKLFERNPAVLSARNTPNTKSAKHLDVLNNASTKVSYLLHILHFIGIAILKSLTGWAILYTSHPHLDCKLFRIVRSVEKKSPCLNWSKCVL